MNRFIKEEDGGSSVEIAIITVVLIGLALAFKKQLLSLCSAIAKKILG